jgi:hypothetical protein
MCGEIKQDGQDRQDKEEMMKEECGMMNEKHLVFLSFILHIYPCGLAFILSILSILLNCFLFNLNDYRGSSVIRRPPGRYV